MNANCKLITVMTIHRFVPILMEVSYAVIVKLDTL